MWTQALPETLIQMIRKFAFELDSWLRPALEDLPENLRAVKMDRESFNLLDRIVFVIGWNCFPVQWLVTSVTCCGGRPRWITCFRRSVWPFTTRRSIPHCCTIGSVRIYQLWSKHRCRHRSHSRPTVNIRPVRMATWPDANAARPICRSINPPSI